MNFVWPDMTGGFEVAVALGVAFVILMLAVGLWSELFD